MPSYLPPLLSLAFLAIAMVLCLHSLFSRHFLIWIVPLLMTLGLGVFTFFILLPMISETDISIMMGITGNPYAFYIFNGLWLIMVIGFKTALGRRDRLEQTRKSRSEYEYLRKGNRKEIHFDQY